MSGPNPSQILSLRLHTLKALIHGPVYTAAASSSTVLARLAIAQSSLSSTLGPHKSLTAFAEQYKVNRPWLVPSISTEAQANEGTYVDDHQDRQTRRRTEPDLSEKAKAVILLEAEEEIKQIERQLSLIHSLAPAIEPRSLKETTILQPRLDKLIRANVDQAQKLAALEAGVLTLIDSYREWVNALSRLFVNWDDVLVGLEREVAQAERRSAEV